MLKISAFTSTLLLLGVISTVIKANELSRCCSGGSRHFQQTHTCSNIKSEGTRVTCIRAASICCLRALLDSACEEGTELAKQDETCPSSINSLGGGLRKECCECCLLAGELLAKNQPCTPPTGFSAACLRSFSRCCQGSFEFTQTFPISTVSETNAVYLGDRCAHSKCDHLCNDRGGENVECTCRPGYDLGPDGQSCVDIDECLLLMDDCLESQRCLNLPGSFKCIRTLSCGTGYAMDSETEECIDVDECNLGAHDCGPLYQCRNTQGSYRCDPKRCADGELQNPVTGECTSIDCPYGYYPANGTCHDVDECATADRCGVMEECVNTPGSYRCQQRDNMCPVGYEVNPNTGFCDDINECLNRTICEGLLCINLPGSYKCRCNAGYEFNSKTKRCEDVDECEKFAGHVCDLSAECTNTIGSFVCKCKKGFKLAEDGRRCEDINECVTGEANCEQKCINIPGSYQCICDRGYTVAADGRTCVDIDECKLWSGAGNDLCMGECINTKGSYLCTCPPGYKIQPDNRTCVDIDECALGECQGHERICVNTLGQFKCHQIQCPENYVHDSNYKNTVHDGYSCLKECKHEDAVCLANHTREIMYQFRSMPSTKVIKTPIEVSRIRTDMETPFSVSYHLDRAGQRYFIIEQDRNIGILKLARPLMGPKVVPLRVNIHTKSRTGAILAFNVAFIKIYVSKYLF